MAVECFVVPYAVFCLMDRFARRPIRWKGNAVFVMFFAIFWQIVIHVLLKL